MPARRAGDLLFIAGQLPFVDGRLPRTGKLGDAVDVPAGQQLARQAALNGLAVANAALGSLAGVSVVLIEALGQRGRHARAAVATPVLPLDTPVEVQLVLAALSR